MHTVAVTAPRVITVETVRAWRDGNRALKYGSTDEEP